MFSSSQTVNNYPGVRAAQRRVSEDAASNPDDRSLQSAASGAESDATVRDGCDLLLGTSGSADVHHVDPGFIMHIDPFFIRYWVGICRDIPYYICWHLVVSPN